MSSSTIIRVPWVTQLRRLTGGSAGVKPLQSAVNELRGLAASNKGWHEISSVFLDNINQLLLGKVDGSMVVLHFNGGLPHVYASQGYLKPLEGRILEGELQLWADLENRSAGVRGPLSVPKVDEAKPFSVMIVPIIFGEKKVGFVYLGSKKLFLPIDLAQVETFVDALELVINAREAQNVDPMTGFFRREAYLSRIQEEMGRSLRHTSNFSVLLLDIDEFRLVNKILGQSAGDRVLIEIAKFLRRQTRVIDLPCRIGGEEFTLVLPHTSRKGAAAIAGRIVREIRDFKIQVELPLSSRKLAQRKIFELENLAPDLKGELGLQGIELGRENIVLVTLIKTVSIGIAIFKPSTEKRSITEDDTKRFLSSLEFAQVKAKRRRNTFVIAED